MLSSSQKQFQSTLPARGATESRWSNQAGNYEISIHAPRTGSDPDSAACCCRILDNFNPRSPHGERPEQRRKAWALIGISIHAPRTGSDQLNADYQRARNEISIHAPRTGSDARIRPRLQGQQRFQSTLPARGATNSSFIARHIPANFNPRSPHGERQGRGKEMKILNLEFQSTLPARGATAKLLRQNGVEIGISIHAPRTGSDCMSPKSKRFMEISIHAPRTGSD